MAQTILGIDVGSYSVKVAEIRRSFNTFHFTNYFEQKIQYNEVLSSEESVAAALQSVLEDNALTWDACYAALPGTMVATRFIDLPFGSAKKIEQMMAFELEEYLPFIMEDVVLNYHVVESSKELSKILTLYARKTDVAKTLAFLNAAGVEPRRLCAQGVELVNLVNMGLTPPDASYALLDVGHRTTTVTICQGKRLAYTRTIALGGQHMTHAIAKLIDASEDEAERLKLEMGQAPTGTDLPSADSIPNKVTRAMGEILEDLVLNLRQTFFAYREQSGQMIEGLYLCGGTTRLAGIDEFLSQRLQQNVTFIDCHQFYFSQVDRADVPPQPVAASLALALRGVAATGLPAVDFRQGEFQYRADTQHLEGTVKRIAIGALVVLLMGCTYFGLRWYQLGKQVTLREGEVRKLVEQVLPKAELRKVSDSEGALRVLQRMRKDAERRITVLEELRGPSALDALRRFSTGVSPRDAVKLNVEKFDYQLDVVKVTAEAPSSADVDTIRRSIETNLTEHKEEGRTVPPKDGGDPMLVEFPPAKTGAKGELKFDLLMKSQAALKREAAEQKGRRRR